MKYVDLFQIITKVGALVWSENSQGKTNQGPDVDGVVFRPEMVANIVHLGMTVVTAGDTVVRTGFNDLVEFFLAIGPARLSKARLEETATATTAVVVGAVWRHFNNIFRTDNRSDDIAKIFGHFLAIAFANNLAGVLNGELDFQVLVPIRTDLQTAFTNPFSVILVN